MKSMNKVLFLIIVCMSLLGLTACDNSKQIRREQEAVITSYLENLKNQKAEDAIKNVLFTDAEVQAGVPDTFCDAMTGYDYKSFAINEITRLNDSVYIAHIVVNGNYGNEDETEYTDFELNPYIFLYNGKFMLAFIKEQVPKSLYEKDLGELPYNYDDDEDRDYIVVDDSYIF